MANNIFKGLLNSLQDLAIKHAPNSKILIEAANRRGVSNSGSSSLLEMLETAARTASAQSMKKYKDAVQMATDPENGNKVGIVDLYRNLMLDNHLASVIESRILYSQRSAFKLVDANGEENKDVTNLLERQWHHDLIYKVLFHQFQGTTLIEMYHLDANGELLEIDEIPQTHFNARKGIITKTVGDNTGWNYREGVFAPYYVQIGKDNALGMLEMLAPIVLAKKLGMGSWLDYIEKYGVPPLFITTDREDDERLQQLFTAASQFKSNQFMIGRGEEKFEVGQINGAGTAPFDSLITRADEQMSKRVLGGAGLTDEKAFVGSAEIQFRLAKDRFESDKTLYRNIFNNIIKPKLIALSPVYAPLANYTFVWDDTENMSKKEIIDAIAKLGATFDVDPEWIFQQTGIPVLGRKADGNQPGTPDPKK